jgi:hypothetical protein
MEPCLADTALMNPDRQRHDGSVDASSDDATSTSARNEERILGTGTTRVSVDELNLHPDNPRIGDIVAIKNSLAVNGLYQPVTVNSSTMEVLRGNHTLLAARELGWREIEVFFVDVSKDDGARILLADNRTSDLGGYDNLALSRLLEGLGDFEGTGYGADDLRDLLDEGADDSDLSRRRPEAAEAEALATEPGDLVTLGEHRLICADPRDTESYLRLFEGDHATVLVTDARGGSVTAGNEVVRLDLTDAQFPEQLGAALAAADGALSSGATIYLVHPPGPASVPFLDLIADSPWRFTSGAVAVYGDASWDDNHSHDLVAIAEKGGRRRRRSKDIPGNCWLLQRHAFAGLTPELVARVLRQRTRRGQFVLDPFGGRGATLEAAEHLQRRARLIEADPARCDLIRARYAEMTTTTWGARSWGGARN